MRLAPLALGIGATLSATACHPPAADAPSLATRPVERRPILPPDAAREPDLPSDPALAARLSIIVADAEEGHRAFEAVRVRTAHVVAGGAGAAQGSEAWIAAQQALSALDAAKEPLRTAAAHLDDLRREPASFAAGNRAAIAAAAARIEAMTDAEDAAVAALAGRPG